MREYRQLQLNNNSQLNINIGNINDQKLDTYLIILQIALRKT